jgi:uncharacterized membrane protein
LEILRQRYARGEIDKQEASDSARRIKRVSAEKAA